MKVLSTLALASSIVALASAGALAQSSTSGSSTGKMQMSDAECQTVWSRINPTNAASVEKSAAEPYVRDFSQADADSNDQLSSSEFMSACRDGMVSATATTGAGAGGSTPSGGSTTK